MTQITLVIGNYKNGGVSARATNIANELAKRGCNVTILVTKEIGNQQFVNLHKNTRLVSLDKYYEEYSRKQNFFYDKKCQNIKIKFMKLIRKYVKESSKISYYLYKRVKGIRNSERLRSYVINNPKDIYIPFGLLCLEMIYYATYGGKRKVIYAEKNAPEIEFPKDPKEREYLFNILKKIDGAIVQTKEEANFYKECFTKNLYIIHNPIKTKLPDPYSGPRRKVVVNFCRISKQKNLHLLINSFKKLLVDYPDYKLIIYGNVVEREEVELKKELEAYIVDNKLEDCIQIKEAISNVHEVIRDCAMFVSSSDFEGLSNSMIEAMAIGMPCVCTDCLGGGASEMIQHRKNGLLVPVQNVDALYDAMKEFIEDPQLAEKCGKYATEISDHMSSEKICEEWFEVINNI